MTIRWTAEQRAEREAYRKRERDHRKPRVKAEPKAHSAWSRPVLLPRRKLSDTEKAIVHSRSDGFCACGCGASLPVSGPEVQYDHILPRALGGSDELGNYQALRTVPCHARKTADDLARIRKADRQGKAGEPKAGKKIPSRPFPDDYQPLAAGRRFPSSRQKAPQ